jgi:hypothetical protein
MANHVARLAEALQPHFWHELLHHATGSQPVLAEDVCAWLSVVSLPLRGPPACVPYTGACATSSVCVRLYTEQIKQCHLSVMDLWLIPSGLVGLSAVCQCQRALVRSCDGLHVVSCRPQQAVQGSYAVGGCGMPWSALQNVALQGTSL